MSLDENREVIAAPQADPAIALAQLMERGAERVRSPAGQKDLRR